MKSVFEFGDYKSFVRHLVSDTALRGHKKAYAKALMIQPAYFSQVLHSSAHLNLEQAQRLADFCGLSEIESEYFLFMLQRDRAGTEALRLFFERRLKRLLANRYQLSERLEVKETLNAHDQAIYYSSWIYSAVHTLVSLPGKGNAQTMAQHLGVPLKKVTAALQFLVRVGVLVEKDGVYQTGKASLHLPDDSPFIGQHHRNWRLQACERMEKKLANDLHYSSVVSLSESDAERVRNELIRSIRNVKKTVRDSQEEKACCFSLDFYEI